MFAASTYEEIERIESQVENMEIVVFLFARPTEEKILKEFEYIHYNSAKYCSIYAIGYTDDFAKAEDQTYRKVDAMMQRDWYFSTKAFTEFKEKLQDRIRWNYSGETEVLVLQNNPGQKNVLNFQNYVAINVNKGIREEYIDSFQSFIVKKTRQVPVNIFTTNYDLYSENALDELGIMYNNGFLGSAQRIFNPNSYNYVSKTVVSQCNNFIIHKIQNPDDIQYISRMVPYMNQGMVDRITYLRRGYALVFGTAINLPTLTAFEKASPSPNSGNSNIVEKWYVD